MITRRTLLVMLILTALTLPAAYAQEITPTSLEITVYSDGTAKAVYSLEADPTKVRVNVELYGPPMAVW